MDLNGDGQDEWLLCQPEMNYCKVYGKIGGSWKDIGQARDLDKNQMMSALKQAASEGKLTAAPKVWQDVTLTQWTSRRSATMPPRPIRDRL